MARLIPQYTDTAMNGSPHQAQPTDHLSEVRREFQAFYCTATATESALMDTLINMHALLLMTAQQPREAENPLRMELEKLTNSAERAFMVARDAVRTCVAFRRLSASDQRKVEAVLFTPFPNWKP